MLVVGFLLGLKHATEADHLAAVATLATRSGTWRDALRQGAAWGIGHTVTLLLLGGAMLTLGHEIPDRLGQALEFCVGVMLVLLGLDVLRRLRQQRVHFHAHAHGDGDVHLHAHRHAEATLSAASVVPVFSKRLFVPAADRDHRTQAHAHAHAALSPRRAMLVGTMHGLAGSAALIVLSVGAAPSVAMGLVYILVFGVGSILGMALLSVAIAVPLRASAGALTGLHSGLTAAVGLLSCALGLWVMVRVGISQGLLFG